MKMRILTLLCYLAAFAAGATGVDYLVDRQQAVAQDGWHPVAVSVADSAQQQPGQGDTPDLRGAVYDTENPDSRIIRVSQQPIRAKHISVPELQARRLAQAPRQLRPSPPAPRAAPYVPPAAIPAARPDVPLEKMIGQMLIFGFQGTSPDQKWPRTLAAQLADGTIGGALFLKYNLSDKTSARQLMKFLHAKTAGAALPPLFAVDQEGGQVQRLAGNVGLRQWPSAARIGRGSIEEARSQYDDMAEALDDWGFNLNFGPVVDVNVNPVNPVIGKLGRSFSGDPYKVTDFARAFIDAHRSHGVLTSIKHFPGHGSSRKDSHLGFTDISQTWQEKSELAPYRELIGSGAVDMVMTGHLYLEQLAGKGDGKYPATLSKEVVTGLLRNTLGYDGVVLSDDMEMGAIRQHYGTYDAAIRAIRAGVDMLIVSNSAKPDASLPEKYVAAIASAARSDPALMARITQSYLRIVAMKKRISATSHTPSRRSAS